MGGQLTGPECKTPYGFVSEQQRFRVVQESKNRDPFEMNSSNENKKLKRRVKQLEAALTGLLDVAWPNPDIPNSRTNRAINRVRRVLGEQKPG
jgi:hypothetical protein